MKVDNLDHYTGGWFVGDFVPSILQTNDFECAVKHYQAGETDMPHYHKVATEITVIIEGTVILNETEYTVGDIIVIEPNEISRFKALTDAINIVVKIPSVKNDKFIVEEMRE